jgi:hypothetical protein
LLRAWIRRADIEMTDRRATAGFSLWQPIASRRCAAGEVRANAAVASHAILLGRQMRNC